MHVAGKQKHKAYLIEIRRLVTKHQTCCNWWLSTTNNQHFYQAEDVRTLAKDVTQQSKSSTAIKLNNKIIKPSKLSCNKKTRYWQSKGCVGSKCQGYRQSPKILKLKNGFYTAKSWSCKKIKQHPAITAFPEEKTWKLWWEWKWEW